jgi:hypothetical protein
MGEQWVNECKQYLVQVQESMSDENPDRLALVKSMHRTLFAINHSILGWFQYVNNPDIMTKFNRDELHEISDTLAKFAEALIEHDIEVTQTGMKRGLEEGKSEEERRHSFYV